MPAYRVGAYDKGSKKKGRYFVVVAETESNAMLSAREFFVGVPLSRMFVVKAEPHDKPDGTVHTFKPEDRKGAQ